MNKFKPTKIAKSLILLGFLPPPLLASNILVTPSDNNLHINASQDDRRYSTYGEYHLDQPINLINTATKSLLLGDDITSTKGFTTDQLKEIAKTYQKIDDTRNIPSQINNAIERVKQGKYYDSANGRYLGYFSYYGYDYLDKGAGTKEQAIFELSDSKFPIGKAHSSKDVNLIESISSLVSPAFNRGADNVAFERIQLSPKLLTKVKINSLFKDKLHLRGYDGKVNEHQSLLENTNELLTIGLFKDTVDYSQILPNLDNQPMNIDATKYEKMKVYYDNIDWDADQVLETSKSIFMRRSNKLKPLKMSKKRHALKKKCEHCSNHLITYLMTNLIMLSIKKNSSLK